MEKPNGANYAAETVTGSGGEAICAATEVFAYIIKFVGHLDTSGGRGHQMRPLALAAATLIALAAPAIAQPLPYEPLRKIQIEQLRADYSAFVEGVKFRWFAAGCHVISELDADAPTVPEERNLMRRAAEIDYDPRPTGEPNPMKAGWRMAQEPGKCAEYWAAHPDLLRQLLAR